MWSEARIMFVSLLPARKSRSEREIVVNESSEKKEALDEDAILN